MIGISIAQVSDTIYVDEVDTVIVEKDPVVVNKTFYHEIKEKRNRPSKFFISPSVGTFIDLSNYSVCETCKENFNKLNSSSSNTKSVQYGILLAYYRKKISVGIDLSYRFASKKINYSNDSTININNKVKASYFMLGPTLGYKIIQKKRFDVDLMAGVLFSFTQKQTGITMGGDSVLQVLDISKTKLIANKNFLYHFSPILTYKLSQKVGILMELHYYFDHYSNVNKKQSYTEQRNTIGLSLGFKYLL